MLGPCNTACCQGYILGAFNIKPAEPEGEGESEGEDVDEDVNGRSVNSAIAKVWR